MLVLAITVATGCLAWLLFANYKTKWPVVQAGRASEIGLALNAYNERHGTYPDSLKVLVSSGQISAEKFSELQFQESPMADRKPWVYHKPRSIHDIAIVSPSLVIPWRGSSGISIVARPDGSGEASGASKTPLIRSPIMEETEHVVGGNGG